MHGLYDDTNIATGVAIRLGPLFCFYDIAHQRYQLILARYELHVWRNTRPRSMPDTVLMKMRYREHIITCGDPAAQNHLIRLILSNARLISMRSQDSPSSYQHLTALPSCTTAHERDPNLQENSERRALASISGLSKVRASGPTTGELGCENQTGHIVPHQASLKEDAADLDTIQPKRHRTSGNIDSDQLVQFVLFELWAGCQRQALGH